MASVTLGYLGSLIPGVGPVTGVLGAMLGSYIDQRYLYPAIFGDEKEMSEGPRLDMFPHQSADPGAPMNRCYGPYCRVQAQIIWLGGRIEVIIGGENATGKGGGDRPESPREYIYKQSVAYGFAEGRNHISVSRLLLDGKLAYADVYNPNFTSNQVYMVQPPLMFQQYTHVVVPFNVYDCNNFAPGYAIQMQGWNNQANNGIWNLISVGTYIPGYFHLFIYRSSGSWVYEGAGANVTISQGITGFKPSLMGDISTYYGSHNQPKNTWMTNHVGDHNNPAYRYQSYMVIENLILHDFGNRVPNAEVEFKADTTVTASYFFANMLVAAGLTQSEFETTGVDGDIQGYVVRGPTAPSKAFQPIMIEHDVTTQETDGKIKFFSRQNADTLELDDSHLGAYMHGSEPPPRVTIADVDTAGLPNEVLVKFQNIHNKLEMDEAKAMHNAPLGDAKDTKTYNLNNVAMSKAEAMAIAQRLLYQPYFARSVAFTLPGNNFWAQEGDILKFTHPIEADSADDIFTYYIHVLKKERGSNYLINVEGVMYWPGMTYEWEDTQAPDMPTLGAGGDKFDGRVIDCAPLSDDHLQQMGVYVTGTILSPDSPWHGGAVYFSDDDSDYQLLFKFARRGEVGTVAGTLGGGADATVIDRENTVQVCMQNGELASCTEDEVRAGKNRAIIGDEIVGFQTATLISTQPGSYFYELSNLMRGLRNTEDQIDGHSTGELFFVLNPGTVHFHPLNIRWHGKSTYLKVIPAHREESDYTGVQHTFRGGTLRPFGPALVRGSRSATNNLTITWLRRSRAVTRIFGTAASPRIEGDRVRFEIDIYDGAEVVRTIEVTNVEETVYTAAMQTTDGLTPGDPVTLKIYEISPLVGRGKKTEATI